MRAQEKTNLFKAGLFVGIMLLIFMLFIITLGSENSLFEKQIVIKTKATNVENLKIGAMVQLKGLKIGSVQSITFLSVDTLEVALKVSAENQPWIKSDSVVAIKTAGVLGDKFIEILGGTENSPSINDGDFLLMEKSLDMKDLLAKGGSIVTSSGELMEKLNEVLVNIENGKTLGATLRNLESTSGTLNRILSDLETKKLAQTFNNLNDISLRIKNGPGTLHSFIYDDSAYEDLRVLLGGAQRNQVLKFFIRESIKKAEEANKK